jgi:hypothetical protein
MISSSQFGRLWQQSNQANIPIEVVEIYSEAKPKTRKVASEPKPVSPKQPSTIQKVQAVKLPKKVVPKDYLTAKPAPSGQDRSAIALTNNKNAIAQQRQRQQELAQQRQRQQELAQQRQRQQELAQQRQRQQELAQQRQHQQELAQQRQHQQELAQQRQRQQELAQQRQRQQELAQQRQRQQELAQQRQRQQELAQQRQRQQELAQQNGSPLQEPRTQTGQAPRTENGGTTAQTPTRGGVIVTWVPLTPSQQTDLMITDLPKDIKLPELAEKTKQDSTISIPGDLGLKTGNFLFSLIIEANGVCSKAVLLPDKNISPDERGIYEQFAFQEVCQKNRFNPAYELADPTKKQTSNLFVRFKIQPANSN